MKIVKNTNNAVLKDKPESFFSTYPEINKLYDKLSNHLNIDKSEILLTPGIDGSIKNLLSSDSAKLIIFPQQPMSCNSSLLLLFNCFFSNIFVFSFSLLSNK